MKAVYLRLKLPRSRSREMVVLRRSALAAAALLVAQASPALAEILGPYTPDEHTLHLWHFNEADAPVLDAVTNGMELTALANGATLGTESYQGANSFGTALCTYTGNPSQLPGSAGQDAYLAALPLQNGMADNVALSYAGASGAFTYEAIVRIDFDPTASFGAEGWGQGRNLFMQLICADADENAHRAFQWRLDPVGTLNGNTQPLLEFINLNKGAAIQSLTAPIPTEGLDAIRAGGWYHVAASYDGQPDHAENFRFYWTLLEASRTGAHEIGSGQMARSLPSGCEPDFAIGQTGRQSPVTLTPNNNFVGLIDEVRLSGVARSAGQMLFGESILGAKPKARKTLVAAVAEKPVSAAVSAANPVAAVSATPGAWPKKSGRPNPTLAQGAVVRGPADQPRVALVFSCRTVDEGTPLVLEALKSHQAKASFFVTGDFLNWPLNQEQARAMVAGGHWVGPQSDDWVSLTRESAGAARRPLAKRYPEVAAHLQQFAALGLESKALRFFLPTRDQINSAVAQRASDYGLTMIAGTAGTLSSATTTVEGTPGFVSSQAILESVLKREQQDASGLNGYLLLFHLDSGARGSDKFPAHFGELLEALRQRGYEFVRVDELLNAAAPPLRLANTQPQ